MQCKRPSRVLEVTVSLSILPETVDSCLILKKNHSVNPIQNDCFLCIFEAYRIGSPPSVAPFEYVIIIWGLLISWIVLENDLSFLLLDEPNNLFTILIIFMVKADNT